MDATGLRDSGKSSGLDLDVCRDQDLIDIGGVDDGQMGTSCLDGTLLGPDPRSSANSSGTGYEDGTLQGCLALEKS